MTYQGLSNNSTIASLEKELHDIRIEMDGLNQSISLLKGQDPGVCEETQDGGEKLIYINIEFLKIQKQADVLKQRNRTIKEKLNDKYFEFREEQIKQVINGLKFSNSYNKKDKKFIRTKIYQDINEHCQHLNSRIEEKDILLTSLKLFYTSLTKASFSDSIKYHKQCVKEEYEYMELLMEDPITFCKKYGIEQMRTFGETEIIRSVSKILNRVNKLRKLYLEMCMTADAKVGYWGLSK